MNLNFVIHTEQTRKSLVNITDTLPHIDAPVTSIIQWKIIYLDPVVATLVRDTIEPVFVDLGTA